MLEKLLVGVLDFVEICLQVNGTLVVAGALVILDFLVAGPVLAELGIVHFCAGAGNATT